MNIIIADDEAEIAEIIDFLIRDKFPEKVETFLVNGGGAAIDILKNHKIDLCISDHNMINGNGNDILKFIINDSPSTSFVLCSTVMPKEMPQAYPLEHVFFHVQKPDIVSGLRDLASFIKKSNLHMNENLSDDAQYIPISLQFLLILEKTPSDVYIRVSENKYVKCLNGNESFSSEDQEKYFNKSITKLYLKKSDNQETINKYIAATITKIMNKKNIPLDEKMAIAHSQLCEVIKFSGMSEELALVTKENINQSVSIIMKNNSLNDIWKAMNLNGDYPSKVYSLHSMLASVIVKKLSWCSESTMFKLTLAAFLQDMTLNTLTVMKINDYQHFKEIESSLSREETKNFLEHPLKARELMATFKDIPPDIDKLILEQHEMPDGGGFPRKLNAGQLGPLSCLFILSGIMARYIMNEGENFQLAKFIDKYESLGYDKGGFKESFKVIKNM